MSWSCSHVPVADVYSCTQQDPTWVAACLALSLCTLMSAVFMQHPVSPAGLNCNVAGRTPDIVIVPLPGVVYASPQAKVSEHGGLMKVGSASGRQVTSSLAFASKRLVADVSHTHVAHSGPCWWRRSPLMLLPCLWHPQLLTHPSLVSACSRTSMLLWLWCCPLAPQQPAPLSMTL